MEVKERFATALKLRRTTPKSTRTRRATKRLRTPPGEKRGAHRHAPAAAGLPSPAPGGGRARFPHAGSAEGRTRRSRRPREPPRRQPGATARREAPASAAPRPPPGAAPRRRRPPRQRGRPPRSWPRRAERGRRGARRPGRSLCPAARPRGAGARRGRGEGALPRGCPRPGAPPRADRGAESEPEPGPRRRRAGPAAGPRPAPLRTASARLPSFARSAILLPQSRPQCIARPDGFHLQRAPPGSACGNYAAPWRHRACAGGKAGRRAGRAAVHARGWGGAGRSVVRGLGLLRRLRWWGGGAGLSQAGRGAAVRASLGCRLRLGRVDRLSPRSPRCRLGRARAGSLAPVRLRRQVTGTLVSLIDRSLRSAPRAGP